MKRHPEPTHETLRREFQQVVARHNELFQRSREDAYLPAYSIAVLLHEIDELLDKHNIDIEVAHEHDGIIGFDFNDGAVGALLGACGNMDRLDEFVETGDGDSLAILDDRSIPGAEGVEP